MTLYKYNKKRNFNKTSEPVGKKSNESKRRFVVQHHFSRREHYDFRLEHNGVLISFAIPKGPSYNTNDKRLAVHVEDHPISYRNFEGTIEKGEYGAGTVMLWDRGTYKEIESFNKSLKKNYLKFTLYGSRLKGSWTLVQFKDNNWLLIKEKDNIKVYDDINEYNTSIKTNRTMEEIKNNIYNNINITNPDKIIYKKDKITKLDIYKYYNKVSNRMLPYIDKRIISTVRSPNGTNKESFFKKHFEDNKYLKKVKNTSYYYIDNKIGLLSEVQMNGIEFHVGGASIKDKNHPNIMVFDLDPDESLSIDKVREGAKDLKKILDELYLKSFIKTSGGKGYHIVVPINNKITWNKFTNIAYNIAKILEEKYPDKYTTNIRKSERKGKIFIDYLRNKKGATSVAPYSLRIKDKSYVSMPIKWSELDKIKPDSITLHDALKRLKRVDPWKDFYK